MKVTPFAKICEGQDGAIFASELFRFDHVGNCTVYDLSDVGSFSDAELSPIAKFRLGSADIIAPHSNAVCFGTEYYEPEDEYPLLYSNVYNNYDDREDKRIGVCCVYRIRVAGGKFSADLVQTVEIGFTEDAGLWRASEKKHGHRPYGNFVVDTERGKYYAFVMRNEELGTRYFEFDLPKAKDGFVDERTGARRVVLNASDIKRRFDCSYHRFIQGATVKGGVIYSTEGFDYDEVNRPAIRLINCERGEEEYFDLTVQGYMIEPELIDFLGDKCIYGDARGNLYTIEF